MQQFRFGFTVWLGACLLVGPSLVVADDFSFEKLQNEIAQTIERARPAVVRITGRGAVFSGVIVSPEGHVLSAAHAVTPGARYTLTLPDGRRFRGTGKGAHARSDSALIMISQPGDELPYAPMGDSSKLVTNQPVLGISFPGGQKAGSQPVVRFGRIVRSGQRRGRGGLLQSSALMEPGDSGGPLFDLNGCVVGIHSRIGMAMERNYEIPVNVFREFWNELNQERSFEQAGIPTPRLGVRCFSSRQGGLRVQSVIDNSVAAKAGIESNDIVLQVNGKGLETIDDLRSVLIAARDDGLDSIQISFRRGDDTLDVETEFSATREAAPKVELPVGDRPEVPAPEGFRELRSLPRQLAELESRLDDACVEIVSDFGSGDTRSIVGVRIRDTQWVVSKSTVVGNNPKFKIDDRVYPLNVIRRSAKSDLVLLEAEVVHVAGVELSSKLITPQVGDFLLSPDSDSGGRVSIVSTPAFESRKQMSRGYLGVFPKNFPGNQGAQLDRVVSSGAAKRAGLRVGDVITKLNETTIQNALDLRKFLTEELPNGIIEATILRGDEELTKSIRLGAFDAGSNHAADRMNKSNRRDGFQQVFSHDADLDPDECGGPLYDLKGNFVGLNIARNSRVRCYAVPASTIADLIRNARQ